MPKPRLRFLQLVRTQLLRQSEDCLYLNVFVPKAALVAASAASVLHCSLSMLQQIDVDILSELLARITAFLYYIIWGKNDRKITCT